MTIVSTSLPDGWALTTLGEIAHLKGGLTKGKKRKPGTPLRQVPYLRVANVQRGYLDLSVVKKIEATEEEVERLKLEQGDVLFNEGGDRDKLGRGWVWQAELPLCIHQNHVFRARLGSQQIVPKLISWWGNTAGQQYFWDEGKQTTNLASINLTKLGALPVLLPPPGEQRRIVEALDSYLSRLDAAEEGLKRVEANLKRYRASVLKAAVEGRLVPTEAELAQQESRNYEPAAVLLKRILKERRRRWEQAELAKMEANGKVPKSEKWKAKYKEPTLDTVELPELPEGWCWASLEALTSAVRIICYGILMPKEHITGGVPYVKVKDMREGRLDIKKLNRTAPEIAARYPRSVLRSGDLLIAIRGTYGRVVDVPDDLAGGNITQDSARLDIARGLDSRYMKHFLLSPAAQFYFKRVARGVAVKGVNIGDLRVTPVALPPTVEQTRIANQIDDVLSGAKVAKESSKVNAARCNRLRQSILRWGFEGKLVDQDPAEEPASALLRRIRLRRLAEATKNQESKKHGQKGKKTMPNRAKRESLVDVLRDAGNRLSPEELLRRAGFDADRIESFYEELRAEVKKGRIVEHRPTSRTVELRLVSS